MDAVTATRYEALPLHRRASDSMQRMAHGSWRGSPTPPRRLPYCPLILRLCIKVKWENVLLSSLQSTDSPHSLVLYFTSSTRILHWLLQSGSQFAVRRLPVSGARDVSRAQRRDAFPAKSHPP